MAIFIIAFGKIAFIVPDHHKKFDFQSSTPETLALFTSFRTTLSSCFLWSSNATPTALSYFSYHLIIIAVCTIASFSVLCGGLEENVEKRNEMELKSRTSKRLFDHVLLSVFSPSVVAWSHGPCLQFSPPRCAASEFLFNLWSQLACFYQASCY